MASAMPRPDVSGRRPGLPPKTWHLPTFGLRSLWRLGAKCVRPPALVVVSSSVRTASSVGSALSFDSVVTAGSSARVAGSLHRRRDRQFPARCRSCDPRGGRQGMKRLVACFFVLALGSCLRSVRPAAGRDLRQGDRHVGGRDARRDGHAHGSRRCSSRWRPSSSETGTYRFPGLSVGIYTVKFELAGFKTFVRDGIRMEIGANAQINAALEISTVAGDGDGHRRDAAGGPARHEQDDALHAGSAAEHPVGARPVGHHRAVGRRGDGPPERRRQPVGPAVELRRARRRDDAAEVEPRRRGHHRHVGDRRLAGLLRLRRVRRDADLDGRRGRHDAVAGRRRQPRDQERHRQAARARAATTSPTTRSSRST